MALTNAISNRFSMTPTQRYLQDVDKELIQADGAQKLALENLQRLHDELIQYNRPGSKNVLSKFKHWVNADPIRPPKGLYIWGGVGRGKTYLMDIFYDCLPFENKLRTHFHRFMQEIHRELAELEGQSDPLDTVADRIAEKFKVICFDEFYVSDIGDAMLLGGLLGRLFENGTVLVATSNIHPENLYENGLQRSRFIPAIKSLEEHTEIVELKGETDYRLRSLTQAKLYHWPLDDSSDARLFKSFKQLAPDFKEAVEGDVITILDRPVQSRYCADDVIWFDFDSLCGGPRHAFDYIEIAKIYHALLIGGVPQLDDHRNDDARRFISLVDELYDHNVKLILTAAVPPAELYVGSGLAEEFKRTLSRLLEMQSHEYLGRAHQP